MQTAVITGASSGLGLAFARALAHPDWELVLVARNQERLGAVAEELRGQAGKVTVLAADLGQRAELERVAERLRDRNRPVDLLINNAGFGLGQSFLESTIGQQEELLAVHCQAVLVLAHAAGQSMAARGQGAIMNVSSVAAFATMGSYSAAKSWVSNFSEGLAEELRPQGVRVLALCPGFVHTEFHQRAEITTATLPEVAWLTADFVVRAALRDLRRGRVLSVPSLRFKLVSQLARHAPRPVVRRISHGLRLRRESSTTR